MAALRPVDILIEGLSGALAGTAGILTGAPFDTLKVRLQTAGGGSMLRAAASLVSREGPLSLYRGALALSLAQAPINSIIFAAYHVAERVLMDRTGGPLGGAAPPVRQFAAGCFSGVAQAIVLSPFELLKVQQQVYGPGSLRLRDAITAVLEKQGPRGLLRGMGATLVRDGPTFGVYFASYNHVKEEAERAWGGGGAGGGVAAGPVLLAGGVAGALSWAVALPADVVKSNIQAAPMDAPRASLRFHAMAARIYKEGGARAFFRGFWPCIVRSVPVNAVTFFVLEETKAFIHERVGVAA